jgi:DNA-directed RNA polymerase specialized sigma24 family protein
MWQSASRHPLHGLPGATEQKHPHFLREQQTNKRLRLAMTRLHEAEQERIWAIVAARDAGLSIRQIATAMGLSRSRIH